MNEMELRYVNNRVSQNHFTEAIDEENELEHTETKKKVEKTL